MPSDVMPNNVTIQEILTLIALIAASVVALMGGMYWLLNFMARREDVDAVVHEAILSSSGYVVVERRKWSFTEQCLREAE